MLQCKSGCGIERATMGKPPKFILLVDDEQTFREVIKMALEAWGYGVLVAEDGEDALSIIRNKNPQLVLSDVIMPRLDGLTLLRILKKWNPRIPVILYSAHPSLTDAVSAMKDGAADVLTKPIDYNRLKLELERLFGDIKPLASAQVSPSVQPDNSGSAPRKLSSSKKARFVPAD
jgi:two-component system, NtrC family, response regulator HydG